MFKPMLKPRLKPRHRSVWGSLCILAKTRFYLGIPGLFAFGSPTVGGGGGKIYGRLSFPSPVPSLSVAVPSFSVAVPSFFVAGVFARIPGIQEQFRAPGASVV